MLRYSFIKEPRGEPYRRLIALARARCESILLAVRPDLGLNAAALETLSDLKPHLRSEESRSSWPGTTLLGDTAVVRVYGFSEAVASILQTRASGLFGWKQPDLPEDLCLMRSEATPWLVSIAHESDAYVDVTEAERDELVAFSELGSLLREDNAGSLHHA